MAGSNHTNYGPGSSPISSSWDSSSYATVVSRDNIAMFRPRDVTDDRPARHIPVPYITVIDDRPAPQSAFVNNRALFRPHDVTGDRSARQNPAPNTTAVLRPRDVTGNRSARHNPVPNTTNRCCSKKTQLMCCAIVGIVIVATVVVCMYFILRPSVDQECQILPNEIICPFEQGYTRVDILSPPVQLEKGEGRSSYDLEEDMDITVDGFNIRVTNDQITIRKQPSDCPEEGEYPIIFNSENSTQREIKLPLKVKDLTDTMQMEITPFTNTSDGKDYVQLVCSGYHKCGTVVVDLELQVPDFGAYNKPMICSRTTGDGKVMDNYGYACTLIMSVKMFQRTENLNCKPTVETLQNVKTTSIAQQSIDVNVTTRSHFILEKGENTTIKWNANAETMIDLRHIQTKHNGFFRANEFDVDDRVKLSTSSKESIATFEVAFRPVTCIDAGTWELHLLNGDKSIKEIQVNGMSTFTDCPSLVNVTVGDGLELKFTYCVPDNVRTYLLNLYGKTSRSGSFLKDKPLQVVDKTTYFWGLLHLNELSVIYKNQLPITCADHMTAFVMSLHTKESDTIQNITSLTNVIVGKGRYHSFSTGGDFRENIQAVINLRLHLGCRPQHMIIHVNGTLLTSKYALTEDRSTGEKIFSKSFSFPKIRMQDNGTGVELYCSLIDDEGSLRNLYITQVIRVIPDTFCKEKPHGCNYRHPYNRNMWVACGEGVIADLRNCQSGLVFVQTNCVGKCCPEDSTINCESP
ncbi:uncharacterized protein LOC110449142 isoform X2 [Mizuhopecten yessoensis]|uniref:uncharacterized protein LOC110449142 isoform X2 n=1 Tax=Mizuhopecten yessoensis TaxID=6573 RepID=UPI000B4589B6|nr:uncharacterized protein LOC110449142 isoform X2 [Mizuhopecten yessoensis]